MGGLLCYTWCGDGRWQFGTLAVDGWAVTFGSRRTDRQVDVMLVSGVQIVT